jgi:hypothetical protein
MLPHQGNVCQNYPLLKTVRASPEKELIVALDGDTGLGASYTAIMHQGGSQKG